MTEDQDFPVTFPWGCVGGLTEENLSVRDRIAISAMPNLLTIASALGILTKPTGATSVAKGAYEIADAMLEARK